MNDEDAFQAWLDEHPDDHTTRGIFGDWLADRGDERAEGYWAMARLGFHPDEFGEYRPVKCWGRADNEFYDRKHAALPHDWFGLIDEGLDVEWWLDFLTRQQAEDAAARAFAKLPAERRAELLRGVLV